MQRLPSRWWFHCFAAASLARPGALLALPQQALVRVQSLQTLGRVQPLQARKQPQQEQKQQLRLPPPPHPQRWQQRLLQQWPRAPPP